MTTVNDRECVRAVNAGVTSGLTARLSLSPSFEKQNGTEVKKKVALAFARRQKGHMPLHVHGNESMSVPSSIRESRARFSPTLRLWRARRITSERSAGSRGSSVWRANRAYRRSRKKDPCTRENLSDKRETKSGDSRVFYFSFFFIVARCYDVPFSRSNPFSDSVMDIRERRYAGFDGVFVKIKLRIVFFSFFFFFFLRSLRYSVIFA